MQSQFFRCKKYGDMRWFTRMAFLTITNIQSPFGKLVVASELLNPFVHITHDSVANRGADTLIQQALEWESKTEYLRAVDCYIKITPQVTTDANVMQKCWMKAAEIAIKFLPQDRAIRVVQTVAPRLVEINRCNPVSPSALDHIYSSVDCIVDILYRMHLLSWNPLLPMIYWVEKFMDSDLRNLVIYHLVDSLG